MTLVLSLLTDLAIIEIKIGHIESRLSIFPNRICNPMTIEFLGQGHVTGVILRYQGVGRAQELQK